MWFIIIIILFTVIWLGCCIASWTFGIIGICNAPKLGTSQSPCCACSASCVFGANVGPAGGNCFMLLVYHLSSRHMGPPRRRRDPTYIRSAVTTTAAVMLYQKKALWNAPGGVQPVMASGRSAVTGQVTGAPVVGQPVMGSQVWASQSGQPVMGQPVMGQPVMGQPMMVNGEPIKTF